MHLRAVVVVVVLSVAVAAAETPTYRTDPDCGKWPPKYDRSNEFLQDNINPIDPNCRDRKPRRNNKPLRYYPKRPYYRKGYKYDTPLLMAAGPPRSW